MVGGEVIPMIFSFRYVRAERESGQREGWWVVYCSQEPKDGGVLYSAEDLAGRVIKKDGKWEVYYEEGETPFVTTDDPSQRETFPTRDEAAKFIVHVRLNDMNVEHRSGSIMHERQVTYE